MEEKPDLIHIKGLRDGLLATAAEATWVEQRTAMLSQIDQRTAFFQGARLALDIGNQALRVNDLVEFRDQLSERGVALWAVISESAITQSTAQLLGLATRISKPRPEERPRPASDDISEETALFLNRTLRSGTRIEFPGHIVILGDVNPGAEIVAEGSVIIWGKARGMVHAGCNANLAAVICGLDLSAAQLRIAGLVSEASKQEGSPRPEIVQIGKDGKLKAQPWE